MTELAEAAVSGDRWALARLLTLVENQGPDYLSLLGYIYSRTSRAHVVGVTGPTGTGKSTLIAQLAKEFRRQGRVAVVAIDPSSPVSGGGAPR